MMDLPQIERYFEDTPDSEENAYYFAKKACDFAADVQKLLMEIDALEHADVSAVLKKHAVVL